MSRYLGGKTYSKAAVLLSVKPGEKTAQTKTRFKYAPSQQGKSSCSSYFTFTHLLVFPEGVANWARAFVRPESVHAAEGAEQWVLGTLVDI